MLSEFLSGNLFALLLIFARVGAAFTVLPGFANAFVFARSRLILAFALSLLLVPGMEPSLPRMPDATYALFLMLGGEIVIGLFIGTVAKLLMAALEVAGMIVSHEMGLASAIAFNPSMSSQESLVSVLYGMLGMLLIFMTNLHHLMIWAMVRSYDVFAVGLAIPAGDLADVIVRLVGSSFLVGAQIAAPFLVVGLLFYLGMGLVARLMPQIQIFFISVPVQILMGMTLLTITLSAGMIVWLESFQSTMTELFMAQ